MDYSSRWALPIILVCFLVVLLSNNVVFASHKVFVHLQSQSAVNVKTVHRTGYHFQPEKHWINGTYMLHVWVLFFIYVSTFFPMHV